MANLLKHNTTQAGMDVNYDDQDYFWYLKSPEFRQAFLAPLGQMIDDLGDGCLDVGCGEGWLSEFVTVPYIGFDGSKRAIAMAKRKYGENRFFVGRIEDPHEGIGLPVGSEVFGTLVLGNILYDLIKPDCYLKLLSLYQRVFYRPAYVIVYDLEALDTGVIDANLELLDEYHASVEMDGIQDIKKHRKILVYQWPS